MKKKSILDLYDMKQKGEQVVWMTAYDAYFASYAQAAGIDMILVGDSLGMAVYGYDSTVPVTMDMCVRHSQAVRRGAPDTFIIGDMPFGSYQVSPEEAVHNAVRLVKEGGVDAVKLEGGVRVADQIRAIQDAGIVVCGHIGLTPQSSAALGGFKAQGRTVESADAIIADAIAVADAGARLLLLEGVPEIVTAFVHRMLSIPVYGIGAGADADGQILVITDLLGMDPNFTPKFAKQYMQMAETVTSAIETFTTEVRNRQFPSEEYKYTIRDDAGDFAALFSDWEAKLKATE